MGSTIRAWVVASSIGAVETLKDQGVCRWNFVIMRSLQQQTDKNIRSVSQAKKLSARFSSAVSKLRDHKIKQSEESFSKVMYLSCWGY